MATRFKRIIEVDGGLVALDVQGRIWMYVPDAMADSPWKPLPPPDNKIADEAHRPPELHTEKRYGTVPPESEPE
jgi:hypothetical protein